MCGFAVVAGGDSRRNTTVVSEMTRLAYHRGPDNQDVHVCRVRKSVIMGHARLSILDLSDNANQPFVSSDKKLSIVFNGEIYNHRELRSQLVQRGRHFKTNSDTEVLLQAYSEWGVKCLNQFNGMFSFAIHDLENNKIFLARDRFGVKPLYYAKSNAGELVICSEAKQFIACPTIELKLNRETVGQFLFHGTHKLNGKSFFEAVHELPAGSFAEIDLTSEEELALPEPVQWYQLPTEELKLSFDDTVVRFREIFDDALKMRLDADVPVASGFSGGLDSSAIVFSIHHFLKNKEWQNPLRTFSGRFLGSSVDEGKFIEPAVAAIKSDHRDVHVDGRKLFDELNQIAYQHDEPLLTSAVYAQWCVFREVSRSGVKVTIDGHGADEILGGYKSFYRPRLLELFKKGRFLQLASVSRAMIKNLGYQRRTVIFWILSSLFGSKIRKIMKNYFSGGVDYRKRLTDSFHPEVDPLVDTDIYTGNFRSFSKTMLMQTSLPPQLQWADRNSMAFGVESRAPFLDYRLVELCINLPSEFKLQGGLNKLLLREALGSRMDKNVLKRRGKQGFESPEAKWLIDDGFDSMIAYLPIIRRVNSDILPENAISYLEDIVHKKSPYDPFLWRAVSLTAWRLAFDV